MKTEEVINILKKIRSRVVTNPTALLDYIDGQIDILSTVKDNSAPSAPSAAPQFHPVGSVTFGTPRSIESLAYKPSVKRFHGADASANP